MSNLYRLIRCPEELDEKVIQALDEMAIHGVTGFTMVAVLRNGDILSVGLPPEEPFTLAGALEAAKLRVLRKGVQEP